MKNTLLRDTFREIGKTLGRFLAIFAIVALGVGFFAGIKATAPDMKMTADKYFDDYRLMDLWLISTMGFNERDIEEIKKVPKIDGVSSSYSMDVLVDDKNKTRVVKLLSIPKIRKDDESYINRLNLVDGRYPEKPGECLAESGSMTMDSLSVGSKIKLSSGTNEDILKSLKRDEYTIVGLVKNPYYISFERGTSTIGNGKIDSYIMIPKEDFNLPAYTDVYLTVKEARNVLTYHDEYNKILDPIQKNLEDVGNIREEARYDEIIEEENKKLDKARKELKKGEKKQQRELKEAEKKLSNAKKQITKGERELNKNENEFYTTIKSAEERLAKEEKKLQEGEEEYYKNLYFFNEMKDQISSELKEEEQKLKIAKENIEEGKYKLQEEKKKLKESKNKAIKEFSSARRKIKASKEEYEKGYDEYLRAKDESDKKLNEAREKIAKGEKEIKDIKKPKWYVIKRSETRDFIDYSTAADRIDAISQVFPVFFFLIAVLVCLTTMARMVDEQRIYIGSLKAMGYSNLAIASKYLIYAAMASIGGSIVGLLIGFKVFPTVIFNAYRIMYIMPPVITKFNTFYALIATAVAVFATSIAAWVACYNELRETPALLLRPRAPKMGKRILLERIKFIWSKLKFTQKVTARNLFRYKKRFIMTIVGISGCTALLVSGFGLKDSVVSIAVKQFDEIYKYQMAIELKDGIGKGQKTEVLDSLKEDLRVKDHILIKEQIMDIGKGNIKKAAGLIVPEKTDRIGDFIILRNRITGEKVSIPEDGAVLTEKMAKFLKAEVGDEIYIKKDDKRINVKITGITENYSFHYIYMSPNIYKKVFKEKVEFNKLLVKTIKTDEVFEDEISKELLKYDDVGSINFITGISKNFRDTIGSLNYVILVLIFSAGALAFIVLYNLTNINISERIREIATIKVLGFYDGEVSKYIYRENAILTIIGTILGLVLGTFLHKFIILTAETESIMFGREIKMISYIYSAIFTMLFSAFVNFVMYFKLKKVNMVESLKSID